MSDRDQADEADHADQVSLRPAAENDLPLLNRMLASPEIRAPFQWFGWSDPGRMARNFAENGLLGPDNSILMVDAGSETLGLVSWRKIEVVGSHFWNMGILLLPEARGRGIGTRAQQLLVRYLFAHTPVVRIEADTDADNIPEQRALEKAGFTREGKMRSVVFRDGKWRDAYLYAVLRDDLPEDPA
jgi:RimJ/RimL family protein N-acetyltransferase